jgi:hypothetical protein
MFLVLPFGLASAPWCFTKIMRTISLYLHFRGVRLTNYLDDFLFLVSDSQSTAHRQLVLDTFKSAGPACIHALDLSGRLVHSSKPSYACRIQVHP